MGGTPTTLSPYALREIVVAIKNHFTLTDDAEITIETTLSELSDEHMHWMKVEGVNRLSLGVQTFSDEGRKILGRKGDGEFAYQRVLDVIEKGFENVSIDLIYNHENQTIEDLKEDLSKIYGLNLSGFSLYSLINMGGQKKAQSQDLKMDRLFFDTISKKSLENGYEFLELTKLVKTDRYKYIINRHSGEDTLPLGAGAGGNLGNLMLMNPIGIDDYKTSIDNFKEKRGMAFHEHYNDYVQIKGDLQRGIIPSNKNLIKTNHKIKSFIDEKEKAGLLQSNGDKITFSLDGIF